MNTLVPRQGDSARPEEQNFHGENHAWLSVLDPVLPRILIHRNAQNAKTEGTWLSLMVTTLPPTKPLVETLEKQRSLLRLYSTHPESNAEYVLTQKMMPPRSATKILFSFCFSKSNLSLSFVNGGTCLLRICGILWNQGPRQWPSKSVFQRFPRTTRTI